MKPEIRIFTQAEIMADSLAEEFYRYISHSFLTRKDVFVALSGGNTPLLFFTKLGEFNRERKNKIDWNRIHLYWGDERCVAPDDGDSNYGAAKKVLFDQIDIPEKNIHRILGEEDPEEEAKRYSDVLRKTVPSKSDIPIFDWIFLGVGDDGHTASLFPNQMNLINSEDVCAVAKHPESGQLRISLTGKVINAAKRITFIAAGEEKKAIISQIINKEPQAKKYPAAKINPENGTVDWYLDTAAADDI